MKYARLVLKSLMRSKRRTALTVLSIAVSLFIFSALISLPTVADQFLAEVRNLPYRNLAIETLRKLLNDEIRLRSRRHLVQSRSFAEMLEASIRKYQNRAIEAAGAEIAQNQRAVRRIAAYDGDGGRAEQALEMEAPGRRRTIPGHNRYNWPRSRPVQACVRLPRLLHVRPFATAPHPTEASRSLT